MDININISGHKLTVLNKIVLNYNLEHPTNQITASDFISNITNNYLSEYVIGKYRAYFNNLTIPEMVALIGTDPLNS